MPCISADVALSSLEGEGAPGAAPDALAGSFTADGLTYALLGEGRVELVAVEPGWQGARAAEAPGEEGAGAQGDEPPAIRGDAAAVLAADLGPGDVGREADDGPAMGAALPTTLAVPASVAWCGADYAMTTLGAYAFAAAGADTVALPATVASIDPRAFSATAVQRIEVDPSNSAFSSHDGALYSADQTRLLLVPGGRQGAVRILSHAEAVEPGALSHGALVDSFSVDSR